MHKKNGKGYCWKKNKEGPNKLAIEFLFMISLVYKRLKQYVDVENLAIIYCFIVTDSFYMKTKICRSTNLCCLDTTMNYSKEEFYLSWDIHAACIWKNCREGYHISKCLPECKIRSNQFLQLRVELLYCFLNAYCLSDNTVALFNNAQLLQRPMFW